MSLLDEIRATSRMLQRQIEYLKEEQNQKERNNKLQDMVEEFKDKGKVIIFQKTQK